MLNKKNTDDPPSSKEKIDERMKEILKRMEKSLEMLEKLKRM